MFTIDLRLLLATTLLVCITYGQTAAPSAPSSGISSYALQDYNSSLQKNAPPSVAAFHETKLVSVDNHRGAANIGVPLYQIQQGGVTIPIRLNYLSTGVKVNSIASAVGLNWSLEAGGSILKDIRGFEDFSNNWESKIIAPTGLAQPAKKIEAFRRLGWFVTLPEGPFDSDISLHDLEPDHFFVNAPGLNTSFTHKKSSTSGITEPFEISFQGNEIQTTIGNSNAINFDTFQISPLQQVGGTQALQCINNIQIRNNHGIKYVFDKLDIDQYTTQQVPSSETSSNVAALNKLTFSNEVKAYHLSKIQDLNGDEIHFEYETYQMKVDNYDRTQVWDINQGIPELRKSIFTSVFYPQLHRIKKILFKNGSVEFTYGFNRTDLEDGGKALSVITIKNIHGSVIKKIRLNYTYFVANTNCNNHYCKRLQLKEVHTEDALGNTLPAHQFFYDSTALPVVGATTTDYLGYSKGLKTSYTQDLNQNIPIQAPKITFNTQEATPSFYPKKSYQTQAIEIPGRDLTPVFSYAKAGSLVKMITPTGAIQEFEYELNSFKAYGEDVPAAGLRIKKQTITDERGNVVLLESYSYKNTDGFSSGIVNYVPPFIQAKSGFGFKPYTIIYSGSVGQTMRIRTYLSSKKENKLSSPGHIVYPKIIVKNGLNNGTTEYNYSILKYHPVNFSSDYHGAEYVSQNKIIIDKFPEKTILHGRLLSTKARDAYGNLVKENSFRHDYHIYERLLHKHLVRKFRISPLGEDPIAYEEYTGNQRHQSETYKHRSMQTEANNYSRSPKTYISKNKVSKFIYDPVYPFVKERIDSTTTETFVTKYYYPTNITSANSLGTPNLSTNEFNTIGLLKNKRMLSTPIQVETYSGGNKLSNRRTNYKKYGNTIYAPENLSASKGTNGLEVTVRQQYDTSGNLVELGRENGTSVVYIYGYNQSSIVAKIENTKLSDIPSSYITAIQTASNNDRDRTIDTMNSSGVINTHIGSEGNLRKELYKLYALSSLQNAIITVYTYDPLIGMTSMTDSRKRISYYDYDSFHRLEFVKDHEGNIVKQHCYNYKGERKNCYNN